MGRGGVWGDTRRPHERRRAHQTAPVDAYSRRRRAPGIRRGKPGVRCGSETVRRSQAGGGNLRSSRGPARLNRRTSRVRVEGAAEALSTVDGWTGGGEGPGGRPDDADGLAPRETRSGGGGRVHDVDVQGDRIGD